MSLESVRKRLAEATPGPWVNGGSCEFETCDIIATDGTPYDKEAEDAIEFDSDTYYYKHYRGRIAETHNHTSIPDEQHAANNALIAHAPTDLELMANVVEAAERVWSDLEGNWQGAIYSELRFALDALEATP